jgi:hypothetical protein
MGMAFSADHFTGRAQGDHSVTFFTQDQGEQHGIA